VRPFRPVRRLDARYVPRLAAGVGAALSAYRRITGAPPARLVLAALSDTGLVGPGVLLVLIAGCLLAVTGVS
jgi:hypothetical protein